MNKREMWYTSQINNDEEMYERVDQELTTIIVEQVQFYIDVMGVEQTVPDFFEYVGDFIGHHDLIWYYIDENDQVREDRLCLLLVQWLSNNNDPTRYSE